MKRNLKQTGLRAVDRDLALVVAAEEVDAEAVTTTTVTRVSLASHAGNAS